ncbi:MAG: universal stress protein [Anaerolineales bacterium]
MTIRSLLLPLDGSDLAESALPAAAYLARLFGASVTLVHVIEQGARNRVHRSRHLTQPLEANRYLKEAAARFLPEEIIVKRHVHEAAVRNVARSIAEHARELRTDLIILCAHGSGGPRDWLIGNIAQQVIAQGPTPVLLLRPEAPPTTDAPYSIRSILLPLDGVPAHERGVALAEEIAAKCGAAVHLATVVPTPGTLAGELAAAGRLLPGSTAALLDLTGEEARAFLEQQGNRISKNGISVTTQVLRGDPADELAGLANHPQDDLIVLGTHGKAGSTAFWNRSVAARVLGKIKIPALLIPVGESRKRE